MAQKYYFVSDLHMGGDARFSIDAITAVTNSFPASTCAHFPRQITEGGSFANKLNAEQYAKQPERC